MCEVQMNCQVPSGPYQHPTGTTRANRKAYSDVYENVSKDGKCQARFPHKSYKDNEMVALKDSEVNTQEDSKSIAISVKTQPSRNMDYKHISETFTNEKMLSNARNVAENT